VWVSSVLRKEVDKHMWEITRDFLFKIRPRSVLDVGCGECMFWRGYGYRGHHNLKDPRIEREWSLPWECEVILCDYDVYNHPLPTIRCDAHNLPFEDKRFEMIISTDVIEHSVNQKRFADEIRRVGQHYALTTPVFEDKSLSDESTSERLWSANPWRVNLVKSFPDSEFSHHKHVHILNEKELNELFPEAEISLVFNTAEKIMFYFIFK
jgi:SAM-dependent methyltransferase